MGQPTFLVSAQCPKVGRSLGYPAVLVLLALVTACSADAGSQTGDRPRPPTPSGQAAAAASAGNAGSSSSGIDNGPNTLPGGPTPTSAGSSAGQQPRGDTCARGMRTTSPVTPTVWLVVDGSSSMNDEFELGRSRWLALRSTLVDPAGVVDSLQGVVRFGMVIYSGGNADPNQCVKLVTVQPALNNLAAITASYSTMPLGMGTPTDKALDHVVTTLPVLNQGMLDAKTGPVYVVLATDGQPNDCGGFGGGGNGGQAAEQRVLDVTARGTQMGMQMFVVSLAGMDQQLQQHLDQVGMATASKTPPYVPSTQADLVAAFRQIVNSASCQVELDGTVKQGSECSGKVTLNSVDLACNHADGWRLFDSRTVQLTGKSCDTFLGVDSMVSATFACDVFTPD
jgi:hypothetical protein